MIDGFEKKQMKKVSQSLTDFDAYGQQFNIILNKDESINFYDSDRDFHQIKRLKDGPQTIRIFNNFLIFDIGECVIT